MHTGPEHRVRLLTQRLCDLQTLRLLFSKHMKRTNQPSFWAPTLFKIGVLLLVLSACAWLGLTISAAREQALTPGEKNLGVAALGIIWGLPMVAFGASGVCVLLVHSVVFLYQRFRPS